METKCVGDNFEMLVMVLAVFVTNILNLSTLASGTNNVQYSKDVTNIEIFTNIKSPLETLQHPLGTNIYEAMVVVYSNFQNSVESFP